jgi:hypothetical protein
MARFVLSVAIALAIALLAHRADAGQACCIGWQVQQYAACTVQDPPCTEPGAVPIAITTLTGSCGPGSTPCLISPFPTCCSQDCSSDMARCSPFAPAPQPSCCAGDCTEQHCARNGG